MCIVDDDIIGEGLSSCDSGELPVPDDGRSPKLRPATIRNLGPPEDVGRSVIGPSCRGENLENKESELKKRRSRVENKRKDGKMLCSP